MDKKRMVWIAAMAGLAGLIVTGVWLLGRKQEENTDSEIGESPRQTGSTLTEPNWSDPFDPTYVEAVKKWVAPEKIYVLKKSYADTYAAQIQKAKGGAWFLNDDEAAVEEVFAQKLKDKVYLACVAQAFGEQYGQDLWDHLSSFLSESELEKHVMRHVRKLPDYRIA